MGVDLVQGCEVTGIKVHNGTVQGVETNLGFIAANKVALAAAGHTSTLTQLAGFRVPLQSRTLQALVSELLEQVLDTVIMSGAVHVYVSQAHKGELVMGAGTDAFNSYTQRGGFHVIEHQLAAACELFPIFARAHLLRTWGGIVDIAPDASPILGLTPIENMYINSGWGTGGFKATPGSGWVYADTIANNRPHDLAKNYSLDRFKTGHLIDEHGAAGVAH
jgi:sarcosine oxidase subunit beta